ncbi:MAG TPA: diacylglycerol kinase family protein [Verrucomicrobiae bacterium]|nr:diacylglycerol kinase family protein [Verrucomicrobiae bacterium]
MPATQDEADVILIFGGDGTVHRHLGQLVRLGLPVLVVPVGSGNDFARSLGMRSVKDSLAVWRSFCKSAGYIRAIDLGVTSALASAEASAAQKRYFCCVAGMGLDAEVARRANRLPRWLRGNGGYALALLPAVFRFAPQPIRISTPSDGSAGAWTVHNDGPTMLAAFANAPLYGGGMKIAPQAKMDDGLLDVCIVSAVDPFKLFCLFPTVYAGRHLQIKEVRYSQAERVRVETERPLDVYADGEYVCSTPVEIGVERSALRVLTMNE